ncbi:MAG: hypothetical protein ABSA45_07315 [Verrucomicrobiota bacterium]|jgi:hypothetical protein
MNEPRVSAAFSFHGENLLAFRFTGAGRDVGVFSSHVKNHTGDSKSQPAKKSNVAPE